MISKNKNKIQKYWFHDDVFKSVFFDSASVAIPYVEEFIVREVSAIRGKISDEKILEKLNLLIEEESAHSKVHHAYNNMLIKEGYYIRHYINALLMLHKLLRSFPLKFRLACCVALEHYTASMSLIATKINVLEDGVDERMKQVWTWHFLEEIDHRSNMFDIYKHLGGSYLFRVIAMIFITVSFLAYATWVRIGLLIQSGNFFNLKVQLSGIKFQWGKDGYHSFLLPLMLHFFHPRFHPNKIRYPEDIRKRVHRYKIEDELVRYFP